MMRSITIFSFFALATVLVIILQPGPRPAYVYEQNEDALHETSRNQIGVLPEPQKGAVLQAPDDVIAKLKAPSQRAQPVAKEEPTSNATTGGSLTRLQAALNASLGTPQTVSEVAQPVIAQKPTVAPTTPYQAVAPELRDMSWQTLNALNTLGHKTKAPGQEGSLLNSIVRRSMGQVGDQPMQRARPAAVITQTPKPRISSANASDAKQNYVVASGDTLALIAIKLYGSALATDQLLADNPALRQNPNALRIGQVLEYGLN